MLYTHRYVSLRRRQNLDRIGSDRITGRITGRITDRISDGITDRSTDRIKDWIADQIILIEIRYFARQVKIKSAGHNGVQAPMGVLFFCPRTPCSHFHGCVEECCVVPPWTKASEKYVSFHQSVKKNVT